MSTTTAILVGIIPSIGVGLVFWFAIRAVLRADRNERAALAAEDARRDARPSEGPAGADNPAEISDAER